jgi:two-component system, NarL family, response regulator DevR
MAGRFYLTISKFLRTSELARAVKEEEASAFAHLSQQEKHVLLSVSEGKTNREIAKPLFLGKGPVRNYVSSILSKLNVNNRAVRGGA